MDSASFDRLTRLLSSATRRTAVRTIATAFTGLLVPASTTAQPEVCRPLGKPCFPNRGLTCCRGATCQDGRCRCPKRARPCRGRCLPKSKCCRHRDCPGSQRCTKGHCQCPAGKKRCGKRCIAKTACCRDGECGAHEACVQGRCACASNAKRCGVACIPSDQCCQDADCGVNGACVEGVCDCATGFRDCAGTCIPDGDCCGSDDCGLNETCEQGVCACATGFKDCADTCIPDSDCCTDTDCPTNGTCDQGQCVCDTGFKPCGQICIPTDDCCDGSECGTNEVCNQGQCVCAAGYQLCGETCIPNDGCCDATECAPNQNCENHICVAKRCGTGGQCRVFVTSTRYNGNLKGDAADGISGADAKCQARAEAAELSGTYKAWLSGSAVESSPSVRFTNTDHTGPYVLVDGTTIAEDWDDLTDGALLAPIYVTEFGDPPDTPSNAWTNTLPNGTPGGNVPLLHCEEWTTSHDVSRGSGGNAGSSDTRWTNLGGIPCMFSVHLYCFEQG